MVHSITQAKNCCACVVVIALFVFLKSPNKHCTVEESRRKLKWRRNNYYGSARLRIYTKMQSARRINIQTANYDNNRQQTTTTGALS